MQVFIVLPEIIHKFCVSFYAKFVDVLKTNGLSQNEV